MQKEKLIIITNPVQKALFGKNWTLFKKKTEIHVAQFRNNV